MSRHCQTNGYKNANITSPWMKMYGTHLNHSTLAPTVGGSENVSGGGQTHLDMENDIYAAESKTRDSSSGLILVLPRISFPTSLSS